MAKPRIVVMQGHGLTLDKKWDMGCTYGKYTEVGLTTPITKYVVLNLRSSGVEVITDVYDKNNINMIASVSLANKEHKKSKVLGYYEVHCDYDNAPSGILALYTSSAGKKMARAIVSGCSKGVPIRARGIQKRTDLYSLNQTDMPAVIIEVGSIKADLKIMTNKYALYGREIAKAICKAHGIKFTAYKSKSKTVAPDPKVSNNREKFIKGLEMYGEEIEKNFKYLNSGSSSYWSIAKKKKTTNCAKYIGYALQYAGILPNGKYIYWKSNELRGSGASRLKVSKKVQITKFGKSTTKELAKRGELLKGDIILSKGCTHTQAIKSANKTNGVVHWYSAGAGNIKNKNVRNARQPGYDNKVVMLRIRIK